MSTSNHTNSVSGLPTCTTPLVIGTTYLDLWGNPAKIQGYVKLGSSFGKDTSKVWCMNRHYDIATGIATDGSRLVNLPPVTELAFWRDRLSLILSSNPPDKLKLVKDGIDRITTRIQVLMLQLAGDNAVREAVEILAAECYGALQVANSIGGSLTPAWEILRACTWANIVQEATKRGFDFSTMTCAVTGTPLLQSANIQFASGKISDAERHRIFQTSVKVTGKWPAPAACTCKA